MIKIKVKNEQRRGLDSIMMNVIERFLEDEISSQELYEEI